MSGYGLLAKMLDCLSWLCAKTGHLIRTDYPEKSEGEYWHCQVCGELIKKENV
jgi:hypothetical protein